MRTHVEHTRTRQRGTEVTAPRNGAERIAAVRRIVERRQCAKVDDCMLDLFTASAILAIYDKISPENQERYASLPVQKMGTIAFRLVK